MITSTQNQLIKDAKKLHMKKYRDKENKLLIEGHHLIETAADIGLIDTVFLTKPHPRYKQATLLSPHVLKHLLNTDHQPMVAAIIKKPKPMTPGKRVLVLENIQDPGNVGTLIRSALAFGFDTLVLDQCADLFSLKVLRSTQGALFKLRLFEGGFKKFMEKHPDYVLIGAHLSTDKPLNKRPNTPYALILGNEGQGLRESTIKALDHTITIPTKAIDSLNVGVAGSIIMHALTQKQPLLSD